MNFPFPYIHIPLSQILEIATTINNTLLNQSNNNDKISELPCFPAQKPSIGKLKHRKQGKEGGHFSKNNIHYIWCQGSL